jgi:hypothetical protein
VERVLLTVAAVAEEDEEMVRGVLGKMVIILTGLDNLAGLAH